jgi:2-dehydropantoate 2-reductase
VNVVLVGAGAVGSILGAHLVRGGLDVTVIARGRRAAQLRDQGIRITGLSGLSVPVRVIENPRDIDAADVLIIATKTYDCAEALQSVRHMKVGYVMGLQNGVYKDEQIAAVFGPEKTLGAIAEFGGELLASGEVVWTVYERLCFGCIPSGTDSRVEEMGAAFNRAGFRTTVSSNIQTEEWSKFVVFVALLPLSALARVETHRLLQETNLARIGVTLLKEMGQLADRLGIRLQDSGAMARVSTVIQADMSSAIESLRQNGLALAARGATGHKVSTLQDIEYGRRLEIDEIMGYASRKAAEQGLVLPTVETCYRLVAGLDRVLRAQRGEIVSS